MAELVTPPDQGLLRTIADLERRVRILERMPSGLESIGTQHLAPVPAARVYRNAALNHTATGTLQTIAFDTEQYDTTGIWDAVSPTRFTFSQPGIYHVGGGATFQVSAVGDRLAALRVNGTTQIARNDGNVSGTAFSGNNVSTSYLFAAGDFVELLAYQSSGGNLAYAVGIEVHMYAEWVGNQ